MVRFDIYFPQSTEFYINISETLQYKPSVNGSTMFLSQFPRLDSWTILCQ